MMIAAGTQQPPFTEAQNQLYRRVMMTDWWNGPNEPEDWLVAPFLRTGVITIFSGAPKEAGKTTFLLHCVKALLRGEPFAEQVAGKPAKVLYVTEEHATFRDAVRRAGMTKDVDEGLRILDRSMLSGGSWRDIVRVLTPLCRDKGLLVIDTFAHFADLGEGQEQDAGAIKERLKPLQDLVDATHVAVALIHHTRKGGGKSSSRLRGSTALLGEVDQLVTLSTNRMGPSIRTIEVLGRISDRRSLQDGTHQGGLRDRRSHEPGQPGYDPYAKGPQPE